MKPVKIKSLSVFFPAYNEGANLINTVNKAIPIIKSVAQTWEVIIVDDGSKDNTPQLALELQKSYPNNLRIVTHNPNRGYGAAFKSGFYSAKHDWIAFTDADGQFDFEDIRQLLAVQIKSQADLVIGYYLGRKVSPIRIAGTQLWQLAVFILFGLKVKDIDCGFKLVSKKVIDTIPRLESERGPFISSEFLIKARKSGFKIAEVGVHHYPRTAGEATGAKLNVILAGFKDLVRLWLKLNFSK